jgi:hypothetical protein
MNNEADKTERVKAGVSALRKSLGTQEPLEHPDHDQIAGYVDNALTSADREILEAHLELCRTCAEDVEDLRSVQSPVPRAAPTRVHKRSWYAAAALAAAAAAAIVFFWPGRDAQPPPGTAPAVSSNEGLDADDRERIASAIRTGRVTIPPVISELRGRTGTLLGNAAKPANFSLLRPVGTAVESTQPLFEWTAAAGATSYVVSVFDDAGLDRVAESGSLQTTQWTPAQPLPAGRKYLWQVRARTATGDIVAPAPPAPESRFQVLDRAVADHIAAVRQRLSASPLALAILLADEGLLDDAEQYLNDVTSRDPSSREAQQLLASVRAARQP